MGRVGPALGTALAATLLAPAAANGAIDAEPVVAKQFTAPVQVAQPPGDSRRLFVVVQPGRIRLIKDEVLRDTSFLDITDRVPFLGLGQEPGLLSVAFPPNYGNGAGSTTRRFYVFFTNNDRDIRIVELKRKRSTGDLASTSYSRTVLKIPHGGLNHFGGQLQFGPGGYLYAATGDGGVGGDAENDAQNPDVLLGKLLRIAPLPSGKKPYTIPPGNPFAGATAARNEIYALGLRNPWRFSFDDESLALAIGDAGENHWEEIDFLDVADAKGANFGWSGYEGFEEFDGPSGGDPLVYAERRNAITDHTEPAFVYPNPPDGLAAVIGGYVVRDPALVGLSGHYLYSDSYAGELRSFDPLDPSETDAPIGVNISGLTSFGVDNAARIYITSFGDRRVHRLVDVTP